ncbi:MAG: DUF3018 family protein [Cyanobacteria bacterium M_DeepCast_100m_m1_067]|nr:DUF3018 family protein [Cyanobacteria bacterium M_DeepCast_100m_m1_067]
MGSESASARVRVAAHRQRLRRQGLRPVQVWIADTRTQAFSHAAHQQSLAVSTSSQAQADQTFIDSISQLDGL